MKKLLFTSLFALMLLACFAQKPYKVMFYNFENLFDTIDDPEIWDEEFLPNAAKKWNTVKYEKKLDNLERVLFDIAAIDKDYPVVIGMSEIENRSVLEDVIAQPKLAPANYRIVHYDSPDGRGVDVGFYYRPDIFKLQGSAPIPFTMAEFPKMRTRDIVTMWGTIENEPFYFMVAHWPSRLGGKEASAPKRMRAAEIMRHAADSVLKLNPATKIVMMGDLNDDATDASITEVIGAKGNMKELTKGGYFNPFINVLKSGHGTLAYQDSWNLFDNIIVSENLATGSDGVLKIQKAPKAKFYGNIFRMPYMLQKEGQYKGYPLRTFVGNNFQDGFSDHFPVYIYISK
ncbi:MAG: endonuclease/exonuclease/phosphatase family protein [Alistipes sp.]